MSSENILTANILDILFQNRNKEYGAYVLRKNYPKHLYTSLGIMIGIVTVLSAVSFIDPPKSDPAESGIIVDSVVLVDVYTPPVVEPPKAVSVTKVATIDNSTPVISPDVTETQVPEVSELDNKIISDFNQVGSPSEGDGPASAAPEGKSEIKAPVAPEPEAKEEVLMSADIMPEFPGGVEALKRYLSRNLHTPEESMEAGSSVRVVARFVVDKDGSITQVQFKEAAGAKFEQEVLRVLKKMPKWKPGVFKGRPAAVYFMLPVVFQMTEE